MMTYEESKRAAAAAVDELLDVCQVAVVLHCSTRNVRELVATRQLPVVRIGRLIRFRTADLDAYIAACRQPAERGPLGGDAA